MIPTRDTLRQEVSRHCDRARAELLHAQWKLALLDRLAELDDTHPHPETPQEDA